jgi:enoyl-CoA hydratase
VTGPARKYVHVTNDDGIATVRLDDPNDVNYVKHLHPMHRELRDTIPALGTDPDVDAIIIAGGEKEFYPVPTMRSLATILQAHPHMGAVLQREARDIVRNLIDCTKPVVAAVPTVAHGMGAQIAFLCDFVVSARGVRFQDTHTRLGLTSGDGATLVWPLLVGMPQAKRFVLRGHPLMAEELDHMGLLAELTETPEEVLPAAEQIARKLAALPKASFQTTKFAMNQWFRFGATVSLEVASAYEVGTYNSPEFVALLEAALADDDG